jgi:putative membrane protein
MVLRVVPGNLNCFIMKKTTLLLCALAVCLYTKAQIPQPDPDTTAKHFLILTSIGNLQEVNAGQLAAQKAKRADVRSFGQMMVKDHGDAEQKLMQLAKLKNINIPQAASSDIQSDTALQNAGDNFDRLYVHAMLSGHTSTVQMFETYATTGKDPDVRKFAQETLPTLKTHLAAISAIDKQINSNKK